MQCKTVGPHPTPHPLRCCVQACATRLCCSLPWCRLERPRGTVLCMWEQYSPRYGLHMTLPAAQITVATWLFQLVCNLGGRGGSSPKHCQPCSVLALVARVLTVGRVLSGPQTVVHLWVLKCHQERFVGHGWLNWCMVWLCRRCGASGRGGRAA